MDKFTQGDWMKMARLLLPKVPQAKLDALWQDTQVRDDAALREAFKDMK